jgi:hypothetical protein
MEIPGHSQLSMTMDLYSHIYPQMRRDVADRMEDIFKVGYNASQNRA